MIPASSAGTVGACRERVGREDDLKPLETLGFIGLGVMGEPMCANLLAKSGRTVYGADKRPAPVERLAARGLKACGSVGEVAAGADAIFLSLPSGREVEE